MISKIPFRKRIALELFRKFRENEKSIHQLDYIFWECTLRCNLDCLHCGSDCKKDALVRDMPVADFIKALDDISGVLNPHKTMIVLTGGEPLLRKDLEVCGKHLYERGFPWGFVSNGLHLSSARLKTLLQSGLRAVTISLDGLEKSHNWLRGNSQSFANALNAIKLLSKTPGLVFDVVTCVNQKNYQELGKLKTLLLENGVREWRIFTIIPIGRAKNHDELQLKPAEFKLLLDFISNERKKGDLKINYGCEGFLGCYESEVRDHLFFCRAGISIASILADGSISACPNLRGNFIQGNIYKDSFRETWENKFSVMRDRKWMKTGICSDCEFFKYCEGNGLHLRDAKSGELLFCHFNKIKEGVTSIN